MAQPIHPRISRRRAQWASIRVIGLAWMTAAIFGTAIGWAATISAQRDRQDERVRALGVAALTIQSETGNPHWKNRAEAWHPQAQAVQAANVKVGMLQDSPHPDRQEIIRATADRTAALAAMRAMF